MAPWAILAAVAAAQVEPSPVAQVEPGQVERRNEQPELDVLTFHRSNYVLTGFTERTQVKFQFSFKYDLWPNTGHHTVYVAYTQQSLWNLYDKSSPFRESNYAPEIFYAHYHSELRDQAGPGCGIFREQFGALHESNGEASAASRSWNRLFGDVDASCYGAVWYGLLGLRAWYPFGLGENPDIVKTQGYGELRLGLGVDDDLTHINGLVSVALRKGTSAELRKGSLTVDVRLRPSYEHVLGKAWKFAPYVWFQYFAGYGETLGTYDQLTSSARVGLGFTDKAR